MVSTMFASCSMMRKQQEQVTKFQNSEIKYTSGAGDLWNILKAYWQDKRTDAAPSVPIPVEPLTSKQLEQSHHDIVVRLGHSSVLMRLDGDYMLLDPVFSERASMVQWIGPKRFHPTPISLDELPPIKAVVISHDHYDHLDKNTIKKLAAKTEMFVMPLKVGERLHNWGVSLDKIIELDWGEQVTLDQVSLTATPSQHFSGRGLLDRDKTLWASWVIEGLNSKVFFSGDSGYFSGFKQIGEQYGPFDLTLIETGAYNTLWADIHMMPEQSLQAHKDLNGNVMMPVHNGTFDLALHNWHEPLQMIKDLAQRDNVVLSTPKFGQIIDILRPQPSTSWWQQIDNRIEKTALVSQ